MIIEADGITKIYKNGTKALEDVSLQVDKSEIFGLLGPNGSGKTTLIRILTSLIQPTSGKAKLFGLDVVREAKRVRDRIGIVQQNWSYDPHSKVRAQLRLFGSLLGLEKGETEKRIEFCSELLEIKEILDKKPPELSYGQRRRVQVVRELLHIPEILFLDEPTTGLDPIAKKRTLDYIKTLANKGVTIFFTTHVLSEAEYMCDRVAFIFKGRILKIGKPGELEKESTISFTLKEEAPATLFNTLSPSVTIEGSRLTLKTPDPENTLFQLTKIVRDKNLHFNSLEINEADLERIFFELAKEAEA